MTSIIFHTWRHNSNKHQLRTLFLFFSWCSFFAFWGAENHVFHIAPFRSTRYVLKSFRFMDVSNRVSKWNEVKSFIFVGSILQIYQLVIRIFKYKLIWERKLRFSLSHEFCEFIIVKSWNKYKTIILVRLSFQITQLELLASYST